MSAYLQGPRLWMLNQDYPQEQCTPIPLPSPCRRHHWLLPSLSKTKRPTPEQVIDDRNMLYSSNSHSLIHSLTRLFTHSLAHSLSPPSPILVCPKAMSGLTSPARCQCQGQRPSGCGWHWCRRCNAWGPGPVNRLRATTTTKAEEAEEVTEIVVLCKQSMQR